MQLIALRDAVDVPPTRGARRQHEPDALARLRLVTLHRSPPCVVQPVPDDTPRTSGSIRMVISSAGLKACATFVNGRAPAVRRNVADAQRTCARPKPRAP